MGIVQLWPNTIHQMHELQTEDFADFRNKILWEELREMSSKGMDIGDRILVMSQLRECGNLDKIGGAVRLADLCAIPANSGNVANYIAEVKKRTAVKTAVVAVDQFKMDLGTCDGLELVERLKSDLSTSSARNQKLEGRTLKEIGKIALDGRTRGDAKTWSTNYFQLDKALVGQIGKTSFTVIAAGPSFGKTALVLNIMQKATKDGKPIKCLYVGMEMSEPEIYDRFVTAESKIPGSIVTAIRNDIADPSVREANIRRFGTACKKVAESEHIIKSDGFVSINEFRALVAMYSKEVDCAIIDYIQQLRPTSSKQSVMEKINEASLACKELALSYNIPIIALSQLNRDGYRDGCKPGLANLRESGQLEQDADNVWMIWRAKGEGQPKEEVEIFLAKNRAGPVCRVTLDFDLVHGRIENQSAMSGYKDRV